MVILARTLASILAGLALLHVYWACGGGWGKKGSIPESDGKPLLRPGLVSTLIVALLLGTAATLVGGSHLPAVPRWAHQAATAIVGLVLVARAVGDFRWIGFFKRKKGSRFATMDTRFYSPLSLALGLGALCVVALRT